MTQEEMNKSYAEIRTLQALHKRRNNYAELNALEVLKKRVEMAKSELLQPHTSDSFKRNKYTIEQIKDSSEFY
jgi:hypothetical protein